MCEFEISDPEPMAPTAPASQAQPGQAGRPEGGSVESVAPKLLPFNPEGLPAAIREHPHWLVCDRTGRPVERGRLGDSKTNPDHWGDFATAAEIVAKEPGLWPYIVLTNDAPFTAFDVDFKPQKEDESDDHYLARINRADAALEKLRDLFPRRYEARSKSGNGFHIIVRGKFEGTGGKGKGEWSEVEVYTRKHGLALTGHVLEGYTEPGTYSKRVQHVRDMIKGTPHNPDREANATDDGRNGTVRPEWARQVLMQIDGKIGRPDYPDWRDISSAVFDGVGVEEGIELLEEVWPEEERGEYKRLAGSLATFIPWGTLRTYEVNPDDPEELLLLLPDLTAEDGGKPARRIIRGVLGFPKEAPPESVLLGNQWLRRGDVGNLVSSAGAGKSVGKAQAAMAWALGLSYFGIHPARPLRIIHFVGEDDEVTLGQCREGFLEHSEEITGQKLTEADLAPLDENLRTVFNREFVGPRFHAFLRELLNEEPADLVMINPLLSYIGGEVVATASSWLRAGLMPILQEFDCGAVIANHTPKLSRDSWDNTDDTYSQIGGAEVANVPRAILTLRPTKADGLWVLKAAKRKTTGWRDDEGNHTDSFFIRQSGNPLRPAWIPVTHGEAARMIAGAKTGADGRAKVTTEHVAAVLGTGGIMSQQELITRLRGTCDCSDRTAREAIKAAEREDPSIFSFTRPNPNGGKALKMLTTI